MPRFDQAVVTQTPPPGCPPQKRWTPREDHFLQAWWGLLPDVQVAESLGRSVNGCVLRAKRALRIKRKDNVLTGRRVGAIFGVDPTTTYRLWRRRGWVHPTKSTVGAGGNGLAWSFSSEALRCFVAEYPWAYDPTRMQEGHWLTDLARRVQAEEPWLTCAEAGPLVSVEPGTVSQWVRRGWLRGEHRPHYGKTAGPREGLVVVRRGDLLALAERLPELERERRSAGAKRGRVIRERNAERLRAAQRRAWERAA